MIPTLGRISSLKQYHYSWWLNQPISTTGNQPFPTRRNSSQMPGRSWTKSWTSSWWIPWDPVVRCGFGEGWCQEGKLVQGWCIYIYIFIPWNPKWRFGRWFSSSVGWFLGSMLILRGVYENITFMSSVWNIAVWVGKDTRWGSRSFVEKNMSTKANILKAIHVPWASCDWWLHVWKIERIDQHQNWQVHVQWCVSNPKDPWDERYIYLHESLIFFW